MNHVDFVPNQAHYENAMSVDFGPAPSGVRIVLTLSAMHDDDWTGRMVAGWESELGKLERLVATRRGAAHKGG